MPPVIRPDGNKKGRNFIDQAESLLAAGQHVAAASLTGAVLERALRTLCDARGIAQPSKTTIDSLAADPLG
jgi:hypothetical protein